MLKTSESCTGHGWRGVEERLSNEVGMTLAMAEQKVDRLKKE